MPKGNQPTVPGGQYSPDFKLKVVLEYIRNPKHKRQILKENGISDEQLTQWHQEFIERANQIFREPVASTASVMRDNIAMEPSGFSNSVTAPPPVWGIRINKSNHGSLTSPSSAKDPPSWLERNGRAAWQARGVVIWDESIRKMEVLTADEAIGLLHRLRERGYWRTKGIAITKRAFRSKLPETLKPNQSNKGKESKVAPEEERNQPEAVDEVLFHLDPRVGEEVFAFLVEHEASLKQLAEEQAKEVAARLRAVYEMLFGSIRDQEEKEIELAKRPLKWSHQAESHVFICNRTPHRGTVVLGEMRLFWRGCIERPDEFKEWSSPFPKLEEALGYMDSRVQQLATDAFCTPGEICVRHPLNQGDGFGCELNLCGFRLGLPSSEQTKACAMPAE